MRPAPDRRRRRPRRRCAAPALRRHGRSALPRTRPSRGRRGAARSRRGSCRGCFPSSRAAGSGSAPPGAARKAATRSSGPPSAAKLARRFDRRSRHRERNDLDRRDHLARLDHREGGNVPNVTASSTRLSRSSRSRSNTRRPRASANRLARPVKAAAAAMFSPASAAATRSAAASSPHIIGIEPRRDDRLNLVDEAVDDRDACRLRAGRAEARWWRPSRSSRSRSSARCCERCIKICGRGRTAVEGRGLLPRWTSR